LLWLEKGGNQGGRKKKRPLSAESKEGGGGKGGRGSSFRSISGLREGKRKSPRVFYHFLHYSRPRERKGEDTKPGGEGSVAFIFFRRGEERTRAISAQGIGTFNTSRQRKKKKEKKKDTYTEKKRGGPPTTAKKTKKKAQIIGKKKNRRKGTILPAEERGTGGKGTEVYCILLEGEKEKVVGCGQKKKREREELARRFDGTFPTGEREGEQKG